LLHASKTYSNNAEGIHWSFHAQHGTKYSVQQKLMEKPNYYNRGKPPLLDSWTRCHKLAQKESKAMISFKNCHHYCQQASIQTMYHKTVAVQSDVHSAENQDQYRKLKYASTNVNQNT
jgi:hypothetical protein